MENECKKWGFQGNEELNAVSAMTIRGVLTKLWENLDGNNGKPIINIGHGDPSKFPCFRTTPIVENAIVNAIRSAEFSCYFTTAVGLLPARRAIAEYLSRDLMYQLSADDVYLIVRCSQAIEIILSVLARPGANILLPKPGYPFYDVRAAFSHLQVRHSGLLSDQSWEIDLESVEALADENTVAIVIISPGNPCGNVFTYQHLEKVAETAKKLGILVIADEVYHRIVFGSDPFVPMGEFGSIVPVVTLGSISKTWIVPGWRIGWIVTNDPSGILENFGVLQSLESYLNICPNPPTFIQGAVAQILENTKDDFFSKIINIIKEAANICYDRIKEIPCLTCPHKPAGSMSVMANLNLSLLEDISDDMDFCFKLAKEESVIVLSGCVVGMKNWIRLTFAIDPASLEEGLSSYKFFRRQIGNNYKFFIQVMEVLLLSKLFKHLCSLSEISP
ncbi:probable aminotransferase TAT2 [Quercus suber]|uniref:probable aminotransferase TAT2 n=1 Tax=Quercus suber TaxID=58331 RepID=UPI0032DF0A00